MSVDTGILLKGEQIAQEILKSEVRKSASSFELRLLNETGNNSDQGFKHEQQQMQVSFICTILFEIFKNIFYFFRQNTLDTLKIY